VRVLVPVKVLVLVEFVPSLVLIDVDSDPENPDWKDESIEEIDNVDEDPSPKVGITTDAEGGLVRDVIVEELVREEEEIVLDERTVELVEVLERLVEVICMVVVVVSTGTRSPSNWTSLHPKAG
jgi:hypothetical protein